MSVFTVCVKSVTTVTTVPLPEVLHDDVDTHDTTLNTEDDDVEQITVRGTLVAAINVEGSPSEARGGGTEDQNRPANLELDICQMEDKDGKLAFAAAEQGDDDSGNSFFKTVEESTYTIPPQGKHLHILWHMLNSQIGYLALIPLFFIRLQKP